ncbi:ROK family protein [Pedobacter arcticus]|uniref:ROK family protein n=1 Tax=Pedobacter arcticus TaxID=752140 RepID=UPI00036871AF|nr:ROK family protein [Pedobacter arcticus]
MNSRIILGVDIGGSHITCALVNLESNTIIENTKFRLSVDSGGAEIDIVNRWITAIKESLKLFGPELVNKIGISMPGPFQYDSGVCLMKEQSKYDALYGLNIKDILAQRLGLDSNQIRFDNDASCFLRGEVLSGAAKGVNCALGLTLGTGLGSARFSNGLVEDANLWNCEFKESIVEEYLSTRWFIKRYFELLGIDILNVRDLVEEVLHHKTVALSVFEEFGKNLGAFLVQFINNEPLVEVVVLGGNIAKAYYLFGSETEKYLQSAGIDVKLKQAELGEEAALIGAVAE